MNTSTIRVLAMFSLIATLGPFGVMAQGPTHFTIPFDFTAGPKSLPAGDYIVREVSPYALEIEGRGRGGSTFVLATGAERGTIRGTVVLTFQRYGDQYFLATVKNPDRGWAVQRSVREKELIAKRASPKQFAVVASAQN